MVEFTKTSLPASNTLSLVNAAIHTAAILYAPALRIHPTVLKRYMNISALMESGKDPLETAPKKASDAAGLYQFKKDTWKGTIKAVANFLGKKFSPNQLNEQGRFDPALSALAAAELMRSGLRELRTAGFTKPNFVDVYLTHFLGDGGGPAFLKALHENPDEVGFNLVYDKNPGFFHRAARSNKNVFYDPKTHQARTVTEIADSLAKRMGFNSYAETPTFDNGTYHAPTPREKVKTLTGFIHTNPVLKMRVKRNGDIVADGKVFHIELNPRLKVGESKVVMNKKGDRVTIKVADIPSGGDGEEWLRYSIVTKIAAATGKDPKKLMLALAEEALLKGDSSHYKALQLINRSVETGHLADKFKIPGVFGDASHLPTDHKIRLARNQRQAVASYAKSIAQQQAAQNLRQVGRTQINFLDDLRNNTFLGLGKPFSAASTQSATAKPAQPSLTQQLNTIIYGAKGSAFAPSH